MGAAFSQSFFLPKPTITEKTCPDQTDRVFLVTGGYAGIGFELCQILYARNAIVYIAGRSQQKASDAIARIRKAAPDSAGRLEFLHMDLTDLATVKAGVQAFLVQQDRLHVLINNAGVMFKGGKEPSYDEKHLITNCVAPCLMYKLLLPTLTKTAASSPTGSVRTIWAGSIAVHVSSPQPGGMEVSDTGKPKHQDEVISYGQSKVGNVFLARTYGHATPQTGVVHASFNPGNLRSELQRHWQGLDMTFMKLLMYPPVYGAYTELWAALSPEITPDKSGSYVYPWGRLGSLPEGVEMSLKDTSAGGLGVAAKFISWCEAQTQPYL